MAMKPETKFKNKIRPYLEALPNSWWFKVQQRSQRGIPDFIGCVKGHFVSIELKVDDNPPDPLQIYKGKQIREARGLFYLMTPDNCYATLEQLEDLAE